MYAIRSYYEDKKSSARIAVTPRWVQPLLWIGLGGYSTNTHTGKAAIRNTAGWANMVCPRLAGGTLMNAGEIPANHQSNKNVLTCCFLSAPLVKTCFLLLLFKVLFLHKGDKENQVAMTIV